MSTPATRRAHLQTASIWIGTLFTLGFLNLGLPAMAAAVAEALS